MPQPDSNGSDRGDWLRWVIIFAIAWDLALVLLVSPFSPPLHSASSNIWAPQFILNRFYTYLSLFYHSLSVPFVAALACVTLKVFQIGNRLRALVAFLSTLGFVLSSVGMVFVVLNGGSFNAFSLIWAGLALAFAAGGVLVYALWPRLDPQASMSFRGRSLVRLAMWVSLIATIAATVVGIYGSSGSSAWGATSTFGSFRLVVASHTHVVITAIDAALVVLLVKHFRADHYLGNPGGFVKLGLYGIMVGVPAVTISTFATVPLGVAAHNAITIFACILLQASLFVMYAMMVVEATNLGIRSPIGVFRNMLTYGLLFVIFWVNVVVTLPGIYVALNLKRFVGLPNEIAFITGHEHILVMLTAVVLLMLTAHVYGVRGKLASFTGITITAGYVLSSAAATLYVFVDWNPLGSVFLPYGGVGIGLMVIGVSAALVGMAFGKQVCIHILPKGVAVAKRHSRSRAFRKPLTSVLLALLVTVSAVSAAILMPPPGPSLGPGLRQLTSGPWDDRFPAWSPNGELIAYISNREGLDSVWVIRPNGFSDRRVSPANVKAAYPSWAPDSSILAYYCLDGDRTGICVTNVADKSWRRVTDESIVVVESQPQWSPDGSGLLFFARDGNISLTRLDLSTGIVTTITRIGGDKFSASWVSRNEVEYSTAENNLDEMRVVDLDTGENRTVFEDSHVPAPYCPPSHLAQPPVWTPDSTRTAYVSFTSANVYRIYVWDTRSPFSVVRVGPLQGDTLDPCWSPKGTDLVFSNNATGHYHIFIAYGAGAGTSQVPAY